MGKGGWCPFPNCHVMPACRLPSSC